MSREIKFRVWDNTNKEWFGEGMDLDLPYSAKVGAFMFDNDSFDTARKDLTWVQFTGLKDKNGKEIYEGDVFSAENGNWEVKFGEWEYYIQAAGRLVNMYGFYAERIENKTRNQKTLIPNVMEIIGNIYENPELLKTN